MSLTLGAIKRLPLAVILLGLSAFLFLPSCATPKKPNSLTPADPLTLAKHEAYNKGFQDCDRECEGYQVQLALRIRALEKELYIKNQILAKFNQVDKDGNLKGPPEQSWDDAAPDINATWIK